jgi:murein L,D-transpeptidase YafK
VKNPHSKFYLSLGLSYPNTEDAKRGLAKKLISRAQYDQIINAIDRKQIPPQNTKLGGDIYIHGGGSGQDWTWDVLPSRTLISRRFSMRRLSECVSISCLRLSGQPLLTRRLKL